MSLYRTWTVLPLELPSESKSGRSQSPHAARSAEPSTRSIPLRVWANGDSWFVEADVPGAAPDAVSVEFFKDRLTVRYERTAPEAGSNEFDDRGYGIYERSVRISDAIRSEAIAARLENGVLRLELPKSEADRPKTIPVSGQ